MSDAIRRTVTRLAGLDDVSAAFTATGQVPSYNSGTGLFDPTTPAASFGIGSTLTGSPAVGAVLFVGASGVLAQSLANLSYSAGVLTAASVVATAISSPGAGATSEHFGSGSATAATGGGNTSVGNGAIGGTLASFQNVVIGQGSSSSHNSNTIIGQGSSATNGSNVVIGQGLSTGASGGILIGQSSTNTGSNGGGIGTFCATTHESAFTMGYGSTSAAAAELSWGSRVLANEQPRFRMAGSTTIFVGRDMALLACTWVVSTDATRTARVTLSTYDFGGTREGFRVEGSGTATLVSVYGAAAVARAAAITAPTDLATSIVAITAIRDAVKAFGITL
jgi:hypothetical protein